MIPRVDPRFNFLFLSVLLIFLPLILIWAKYGKVLRRYRKTLGLSILCCAVFGGGWQYLAIQQKIWGYSDRILGIWLFGIPLEEHLFDILLGSLIVSVVLIVDTKNA